MTDLQSLPAPVAEDQTTRRTRRWRLALYSALAGMVLAVIWSPRLVDGVIAGSIADPVVGGKASEVAISGSLAARSSPSSPASAACSPHATSRYSVPSHQ